MFGTRLIEGTETNASENGKNHAQNTKVNKCQALPDVSDETHNANESLDRLN